MDLKYFLRAFLVVACLFAVSFANAQPGKRHGCHHYHNNGAKRKPLTAMEKVLLNQSIARSDTFDILQYIIHIDVTNYAGHEIKAHTSIKFHPLQAGQSSIRFDLMQLTVDSITNGNNPLAFSHTGEILNVQFANELSTDDTTEIVVHYHGSPYQDPTWGGFYFESNYIYNLGIGLTTIPPNFGRVWYPCFDSFVERATYEYHVKSAGSYRAHCQGTFLGELALAGDTVIRSFAFNQPIPTHLSAIAVADYADADFVHAGANGNIDVRLTAKSGQLSAMQNVFQNLGDAIDACEYWYGPYAWERVGYVLTTDGALEIPTNIAYPQYMTGEAISANDGLLSHELGHHWWGDMVTPHNHNDMWLKEGPAEYSAHLMVEWMNGEDDFIKTVKTNQLDVLKNAHIDDGDFQPMSPMPDEYIYGTHTYYKGASVMHNLRGYMGDELFRQAMTGVQANYMYQDVTPEEFRDALEAESGYQLDDFFDDQIFSTGFSTFVVDSFTTTVQGANYQVMLHIQQKVRECPQFYSNVPLDVTFIDENWQRTDFQILANGQYTNVNLSTSTPPIMVVLNGHNRLNQARMDYEFVSYPNVSFFPALPYVDFKLTKENVVDSSLVRIEHIWAAPDQNNLGEGVFEISNKHYWIVDGQWSDGDHFSSRLNYNGAVSTDLDFDLYNAGEQQAVLLYRRSSYDPWEVCPGFTMGAGSLTNGDGYFNLDTLRFGQYAFGNGDASVIVPEILSDVHSLAMYPVPTSDQLRVKGNFKGRETALFEVFAIDGEFKIRSSGVVESNFDKEIDTSMLASGLYVLQVKTVKGELLGTQSFEIAR